MSERKNIKRNKNRVSKQKQLETGRKGYSQMKLIYDDPYLQKLVNMGLM